MSAGSAAPVLIVGAGPVGLALALVLARQGVASVVLEARHAPTPRDESRAITWMPRGLDLLDWLGLTPQFRAAGVLRRAHEFWDRGGRLAALRFDALDHPHPSTLQLPQHDTETLLEKAARATGLVEIRRGVRVGAAGQDDGGAWVEGHFEGGSPLRLRASWAVAADGARSEVRRHLGIGLRWRDYGTDSAVADFEMETHLPTDVSRIVLDPARPHGFFAFAPGRWRFIYRLNAGEDRRVLTTEERATELLLAHLPQARVGRFLWASAFRLGQGQSASYRHGRWLLVGDAAHPMGPSAGAGMMVGLLGAWRLGPLLAAVAGGALDPAAGLAAYEREQRAGATEVQRANELIFRNLAVADHRVAALRSLALRGLGRLPALNRRLTETEALIRQEVRTAATAGGGSTAALGAPGRGLDPTTSRRMA